MGFSNPFKKSRKQIIKENQERGKAGEDKIRSWYEFLGNKVTRTGRGSDFKIERKNYLTGEKERKWVEVKTGNSKLSRLQRLRRRQHGENFVEERLETSPFGLFVKPSFTQKQHTPKKRKNSSRYFDLLGSGYGGKKSKASRYDDLLGSKSRKKKSSRYSDLTGF